MDTAKFSEMLTKYGDNYEEQAELGEVLFSDISKKEWQEAYRRRARELSRFYMENEEIIKGVSEALQEPLTGETAEFLYQEMSGLFRRRCFDTCMTVPILGQLIPFYEKEQNYDRLIRVYEAANMVLSMSAAEDGCLPLTRYQYAEKILELREKYTAIKEARGRIVFFEMSSNLCGTEGGLEYLGIEKAYQYVQEMLSLWNSKEVQELDGENEQFQWYVSITQSLWVNNMGIHIDKAPAEIQEFFIKLSEEQFEEERGQNEELYQYEYCVYENHLRVLIMRGKISREEGIQRIYQYYKERVSHFNDETEEDENEIIKVGKLTFEETLFLLSAPATIVLWTKQCGRDALPDEILKDIIEVTRTILYKRMTNTPGRENEVNDMLTEYCFTLLPFLRSREEKEQWMFSLIVCRQLPTYIHCSMVKRLAEIIFEDMFRNRPELFSDVCTQIAPSELPEFVEKCAVFHDVGKNRIAGIINIQTRAIRDNEFNVIRTHPDLGHQLICSAPEFVRYKDVVRGHHKFYNGQGGYPIDFDNTKSPYRSIIDLITICDCMDAATDVLGRNYKRAKTADEVLEEFKKEKGIRYNPDMVDYICSSEALRQRLRRFVSEERIEIAYEIYSDFMK